MWQPALAFVIYGSAGAVLVWFQANPFITSLVRFALAGLLLLFAGVVASRLRMRSDLSAPISWRNPVLWLSGLALPLGNIFYNISASTGPVALVGLIYGYVPIVINAMSGLLGLDRAHRRSYRNWVGLALGFLGNYLIFQGFEQRDVSLSLSFVAALIAAGVDAALPLFSAQLQSSGLGTWTVIRGQNMIAGGLAAVALVAGIMLGLDSFPTNPALFFAGASFKLGALNSILLTIIPLYLWYRGIQRFGPGRTAVFYFLEPLVATLLSIFVLRDVPMQPGILGGIGLVLLGILLSVL